MLVLFQEGIPDVFSTELKQRGLNLVRFPTAWAAAEPVLKQHAAADAIFFRANFNFSKTALDALPKLSLAALVSTGTDNVDQSAIAARGVRFTTAEGANAQAVFDYAIQALLLGGFEPAKHSVGIVGAGRIGGRLLRFLASDGVRTAFYDPFLNPSGSLEEVLQCDFVSFHVPLTHGSVGSATGRRPSESMTLTHGGVGSATGRMPSESTTLTMAHGGAHPTAGMLNAKYFAGARHGLKIIQTCRGGIWNRNYYENLAKSVEVWLLAQDVYPEEPPVSADLKLAAYSTPHIAGYSTRGRLGGIVNGLRALIPGFSAAGLPPGKPWTLESDAARLSADVSQFPALRDGYAWRKEFHEFDDRERWLYRQRFPDLPDAFFEALFSFDGTG